MPLPRRVFALPALLLAAAAMPDIPPAAAATTAAPPSSLRPVDRDAAWWPERHAQKLAEKAARADEIELVFVGDSITHGWEAAGRELWQERFAPRGTLNLGYSGDRTEHVLWRLGAGDAGEANNEVAGLTPQLFVVMIGTNNTGHQTGEPAETAAGVTAIVDRLLDVSPESHVLLLAIFPRAATADDAPRRTNDAVNQRIATLGERAGVTFLDINDVFLDDDGVLPESVMPDRLHPNAEGYALWADAIEPHVARLMGE